jgi:biotin carboxyl carrier protein
VVRLEAELDGRGIPLEVTETGGRYRVRIGDEVVDVDARRTAGGLWSLLVDGASAVAEVAETDGGWLVTVGGEQYRIAIEDETRYLLRTHGGTGHPSGQVVKAPMPGRVVLVEVVPGQAVQPGDGLVILEAMKMENEFKASAAGTVREVRVRVGQAVNPGDVMVVIE